MEQLIKVFDEEAESIKEGDVFTAKVRFVEGHKLVELRLTKRARGPFRSDE